MPANQACQALDHVEPPFRGGLSVHCGTVLEPAPEVARRGPGQNTEPPLFSGGPGKTWSPEDLTSLMDDLEAKVFAVYDDDTVVHPGHGDATTLGAERPHLQEWARPGLVTGTCSSTRRLTGR